MRSNAARLAGRWAVWSALYGFFDCSIEYLRQKKDGWNSIAAGAAAAGFLELRAGARLAARSAIGGLLFGLFEGVLIIAQRPPAEEKSQSAGAPAGIALPSEAHPKECRGWWSCFGVIQNRIQSQDRHQSARPEAGVCCSVLRLEFPL